MLGFTSVPALLGICLLITRFSKHLLVVRGVFASGPRGPGLFLLQGEKKGTEGESRDARRRRIGRELSVSLGALLPVGLQSCRLSGSLASALCSLGFSACVKKPETKQRTESSYPPRSSSQGTGSRGTHTYGRHCLQPGLRLPVNKSTC